jgi:hypothetical protein
LGGFFGRIFWEEFFGSNYLVEINKELMFLSRFCLKARKEGRKISILRSACKHIALNKHIALKNTHSYLSLLSQFKKSWKIFFPIFCGILRIYDF